MSSENDSLERATIGQRDRKRSANCIRTEIGQREIASDRFNNSTCSTLRNPGYVRVRMFKNEKPRFRPLIINTGNQECVSTSESRSRLSDIRRANSTFILRSTNSRQLRVSGMFVTI